REGLPIEPSHRVRDLSVAARQRVEIVKVLWRGARLIAFDEPTGALGPTESAALCETVRRLASTGRAVLFVSHKLREVLAVADRVAVLRAGKLVGALKAKGAEPERIAALMVGQEGPSTSSMAPRQQPRAGAGGAPEPGPVRPSGPPLVRLVDAHCLDDRGAPALRGLFLDLAPGEVVGVAGVDGNGQRELAEVLTGLRPLTTGRLELQGRDSTGASPGELRALGVAHVPEDRLRGGLCGALSIAENLALGGSGPLRRRDLLADASRAIRDYDIRPPEPDLRAAGLSGGNQQKVVLARELRRGPKLVVAVHPTRGLDLHAQSLVRTRLREAALAGAAILLVSFDLDELRAIASRIVVVLGGRLAGEAPAAEATDRRLAAWMSGAAAA
ncbi:MAG: ATP-binding cassette domain-containing protein, partial [Deltaproteobacteria bacterium]